MLISIIIPIYNVDKYLSECLMSIKNQTFEDYEVIMVDDGSTDNSPHICDEFSKADGRFHTIHKENGGQSTARNRGVEIAKGDYLLFLDSDDFFTDAQCLEVITNKLRINPDVLVYRYYKYYSDSKKSDCGINMSNLGGLAKMDMIKELVKRDSFFCSCWSKAVKRSLITENNIRFDELSSCEDMDWYFNVIEGCHIIEALDYPVVNYRQREGSVTSGGYKEKNIKDFISTITKWRRKFEEIDDNDTKYVMLSALAKLYCNLLISFSSNRSKAMPLKEKVFNHRPLLGYDLNPRTKKIRKFIRAIGIEGFSRALSIYRKFR